VNRSIVCFNDALRGDLRPWEAPGGLAGDRVLQWSLAWDAGNSTAPPLLRGQWSSMAPKTNKTPGPEFVRNALVKVDSINVVSAKTGHRVPDREQIDDLKNRFLLKKLVI
jgi:hypothetical protein